MRPELVAFTVTAIISSALGVAAISQAIPSDVRASGFGCVAVNGTQIGRLVNAGNDSTGATLNVACPVPDVYNGIQDIPTVQVEMEPRDVVAGAALG